MKKITLLCCAFALIFASSCETESIDEDVLSQSLLEEEKRKNPKNQQDPITPEDIEVNIADLGDACVTTVLVAGQHHTAGEVNIYNDGENLIVVYTSNGDWDLGTTHLSLGNCSDIPLTGAGNPKIGRFQFTQPYSADSSEVVYVISLDSLDITDGYCFAAHAEVQGPTGGETAWAEGAEFSGNSWAMFVETSLSDCPQSDDDEDDDDDDEQVPV